MTLSTPDAIILLIYFASMIGIGLYVGRKNKSTDQYFLGGKSSSGLVIGISFVGSIISSSTFLAIPADAFKTAWLRFVPNLAFPFIAMISAFFLIPFFRRGTITSSYQYLALRFGNSISAYAGIVFIITQLLRTSTIAYLLSLLVGEMTGLGFTGSLLIIVGITAIYTVKGGLNAVIWTDVIQAIILVVGGLVCIAYPILDHPSGLSGLLSEAVSHHKFSFYDLDPASGALVPTPWFGAFSEKTVFLIFLVGFIQFLNGQFDQSTVQRWCTTKSAKEARKSMFVLAASCLPIWALFQIIGVCLFVFFLHHPDPIASQILEGTRKAEEILPHFITHYLPIGLPGLVIAGAFAAGMSTLSAATNVASMVSTDDIYAKYINKKASDSTKLRLGKLFSVSYSLVMILGALAIYKLDMLTLVDFMLSASVIITIGIPSVFLAGMFTKRIQLRGIWIGVASAFAFMFWVLMSNHHLIPESHRLNIPTYYASIIGNFLSLAVAYLYSFFCKPQPIDLNNLTVWTQSNEPLK